MAKNETIKERLVRIEVKQDWFNTEVQKYYNLMQGAEATMTEQFGAQ